MAVAWLRHIPRVMRGFYAAAQPSPSEPRQTVQRFLPHARPCHACLAAGGRLACRDSLTIAYAVVRTRKQGVGAHDWQTPETVAYRNGPRQGPRQAIGVARLHSAVESLGVHVVSTPCAVRYFVAVAVHCVACFARSG